MNERSVWEDAEEEDLYDEYVEMMEEKGFHRVVYGPPVEEHPVRNDAMATFACPQEMLNAITIAARKAGSSRSAWLRSVAAVALGEGLPEGWDSNDE